VAIAAPPTIAPATSYPFQITGTGLRHFASNLGVAFLFFITLLPAKLNYGSQPANWIWLGGAALMGLLALIRLPPRSSTVTPLTLLATTVSIFVPALMRPEDPSHGLLALGAVAVELIGVALGQVSRLYLGRRFALLPANRGVMTRGPFRFVRHPVYAGWLILSIGYVMAFPSVRNGLIVVATMPFILWRIVQEETLLAEDPEFRDYLAHTRWRLIPGLY
jgi:protein-S-isoprenylcysteine O-methyltransferase Ste14